jgi:hypothetical protein
VPVPPQSKARPSRVRLSRALSALVADKPNWWSESLLGGAWAPFHAALDPGTALTTESVRTAAHGSLARTITSRPFSDCLDYVLGPRLTSASQARTWSAFATLTELLLTDLVIL